MLAILPTNFGDLIGNTIQIITVPLSLSSLITVLISWVLYIVGVIAFFYLIYSGVLYITAGGNADQAKKAQLGLINAIIGIIIVVLSFVILRAVASIPLTGTS